MEDNSSDVIWRFLLSPSMRALILGTLLTLYAWLHDHALAAASAAGLPDETASARSGFLLYRRLRDELLPYRRMLHGSAFLAVTFLLYLHAAPVPSSPKYITAFLFTVYLLLFGVAALGRWIGARRPPYRWVVWAFPAWVLFLLEDLLLEPFAVLAAGRRRRKEHSPSGPAAGTVEMLLAKEPGELTVSDVMIPRVELPVLYETDSVDELPELKPGTWIPFVIVLADTDEPDSNRESAATEDVIGLVPLHTCFTYLAAGDRTSTPLGELPMTHPRVVADSQRLVTVWSQWQQDESAPPLALVYDEFGSFQGVVRREDVAAALLLSLNQTLAQRYIQPDRDGFIVLGRCPIEIFWGHMGWESESIPGGVETVAGWVGSLFAHIPAAGETIIARNWRIEVTRVNRNRIEEIHIRPATGAPAPSPESAGAVAPEPR